MLHRDGYVEAPLWPQENAKAAQALHKGGEESMKDPCIAVSKLLERYFDRDATDQEKAFVVACGMSCRQLKYAVDEYVKRKSAKNPVCRTILCS
jgi:hypothetical protein